VWQSPRLRAPRPAIRDAELAEPAAERALRGAGAIYAALAARLGLPLVRLDREQRRRADGVVEVGSVE
jgi:predicted nucleic acid-binding protein